MSHLANTTNTESDFYNARLNIEFKSPHVVRESDVIDARQILKKRYLVSANSQLTLGRKLIIYSSSEAVTAG